MSRHELPKEKQKITDEDVRGKRDRLLSQYRGDTRGLVERLLIWIKTQENRLHVIEEAIDGWSVDDLSLDPEKRVEKLEQMLREVQFACPWDDENESRSWFFDPPGTPGTQRRVPVVVTLQTDLLVDVEDPPQGADLRNIIRDTLDPGDGRNVEVLVSTYSEKPCP